jgi:hypothetical protein
LNGTLIGIDFRPANGLLYGVTNTSRIYTINTASGAATLVSTITPLTFDAGAQSGMDFNPVPDRLRLVGSNNQNLRLNVDTGVLASETGDAPLVYAEGDPNFGADPNITAAAYTNSFPGPPSPADANPPTRTTQLFNIDAGLDVLVLQNPPNDGVLTTIGSLGVDFGSTAGFDIFSPANGSNTAFAVSGSTLYSISLSTGAATSLGSLNAGPFIGLAAIPGS